ncbi:hypothetical protein IFM89_017895 [Coptis chinensis]|uniref:Uncharacterized protein n=1 Tax=Coptis chinensis TaxID=261450 RepID=A0A835I360_9MAGN|nr:hypothetical protein IFM89_017895 [Coptis chinensis]
MDAALQRERGCDCAGEGLQPSGKRWPYCGWAVGGMAASVGHLDSIVQKLYLDECQLGDTCRRTQKSSTNDQGGMSPQSFVFVLSFLLFSDILDLAGRLRGYCSIKDSAKELLMQIHTQLLHPKHRQLKCLVSVLKSLVYWEMSHREHGKQNSSTQFTKEDVFAKDYMELRSYNRAPFTGFHLGVCSA